MPASLPAFALPAPGPLKRLRSYQPLISRLPRRHPFIHSSSTSSSSPPPRASLPSRPVDSRGFVLPQPGDVVLFPGRWADEDAAGLVENVRYVEQRNAHTVDVVTLRRISSDLFAVPASRSKTSNWFDVAEVRLIPTAQYVPEQDAYRVEGARDGYANVTPRSPEDILVERREYEQLKREMLQTTTAFALGATALTVPTLGVDLARVYAYGAAASIVYLLMLQGSTDTVGEASLLSKLFSFRLIVPVIPFALLAAQRVGVNDPSRWIGSLSSRDALALVLGLLTYKVPVLARTATEFVDGLAGLQPGKTGMVGTVAGMAARKIQSNRDVNATQAEDSQPALRRQVVVFAGPSGVGKNTLIDRMRQQIGANKFAYSVSHTTRPSRDGEVDTVDYNFVTNDRFEQMIRDNRFIEYARVHSFYYGTSYEAVDTLDPGLCCVLDLDVQGVEALQKRVADRAVDWHVHFVWVAPPSIDELDRRLRGRGSESEAQIKARLDTAIREMTFAATSNIFDLIVVNDRLDDASDELVAFINKEIEL